jgi:hypothetical protein
MKLQIGEINLHSHHQDLESNYKMMMEQDTLELFIWVQKKNLPKYCLIQDLIILR